MKTIEFYRSVSGNCPVEDHLDNLTDAQVKKSQKMPKKEIELAEKRKKEYLSRRTANG
ncbi:MAG: hypothetical protein ABIJ31_04435 [Pseudomonadota bacterium]